MIIGQSDLCNNAFSNGNPIYFAHPTGKGGEVRIVHGIAVVTSTIVLCGSEATKERAQDYARDIANAYNAAGGKIMVDGKMYPAFFMVKPEIRQTPQG